MQREIVGFHQDDQADWVAELSCGHQVHMRHDPPWTVRAWVLEEAGRAAFLGQLVECRRCGSESGTRSDI